MARYSDILTDQNGVPISGALVYVTIAQTGSLASITLDSGSMSPNPFYTAPNGSYSFNAADNFYNLTYRYGGRTVLIADNVAIGNPPQTTGLSAYQVWLQAGNTGTITDYLASLQGPPGPPFTPPSGQAVL